MKKLITTIILFAYLLCCSILTAQTKPAKNTKDVAEKPTGKKYAVLVGVNDYVRLRNLQYTKNDIEALRDELLKIGFDKKNVYCLVSGAANAKNLPTKENIEIVIETVLKVAKAGDTVIIAMSGHGVEVGGQARFCPPETKDDIANLEDSTVAIGDIFEKFEQCGATMKLMIIDACRNDPFRTKDVAGAKAMGTLNDVPKGIMLLQSCAKDEKSYEDENLERGVFTHYLVEGLRGEAANKKGEVTLLSLTSYVIDETQQHALDQFRARQQPYLKGEITDFVLVASKPKPVAIATPKPEVVQTGGEKKEATFDRMLAGLIERGKAISALQKEYETATPSRQNEIVREAEPLLKKTRDLYLEIVPVAVDLFKTERLTNKKTLNDFLMDYAEGLVAQDDYEKAYTIATMLWMDGLQEEHPDLMDLTGIASFMVNLAPTAEDCFKKARSAGSLSARGTMCNNLIPYYKEAFAAEQKIREAEQADNLPQVLIKTSKGDITVELFENEAPNTVANFISLAQKGFYNGKTFHRVIPGFMAQGGCPLGTGTGGPGYSIKCETDNPKARKHFRGTLSMANAGKNTGGSQFFITFVPSQHLDGVNTAFGRVIKGMDVLSKLERIDPEKPISGQEPDKIIEMKVLRMRQHAYTPEIREN